jgi:DNA-binding MarR family transcriptional regulator
MGWVADLLKEIPSAARYKSELEAMEKENLALRAENSFLKSQLEAARRETETLQGGRALPQDAEAILRFVASNEDAMPSLIAQALSMSKGVVEMHLDDLENKKYLDGSYAVGEERRYYLQQAGRKYLHAKGAL